MKIFRNCCVALALFSAVPPAEAAKVRGTTLLADGKPAGDVQVTVHSLGGGPERAFISNASGAFEAEGLPPGRYELRASKDGAGVSTAIRVELAESQILQADLTLQPAGFIRRFFHVYAEDWKAGPAAATAAPRFRGYPAPVDGPPFPFAVWPYGGSVVIGQPWTQAGPLMTAIWGGSNGDAWKKSGIQIYGWLNAGANVSTSKGGGYANFPEAYAERQGVQLDQEALYIERQPDTVQTDHLDWGFRITALYGLDYRFTTAKGILSHQLLEKNQENGFDVPMAYFDLYLPQVAKGMDIRAGRYISLPDIEAQLAPNNYTYSHSLLYTFDCYTQTGINTTTKLSDHWLFQLGFSGGCDVAPWDKGDRKPTINSCLGYTWREGMDNIYVCDNTINDGKYAYNNLTAYYATWYHKYGGKSRWHSATETWYQYEKHVPNVNNPGAAGLLETGANGAACNKPSQLTCFAPEWAIVNYQENQLSKHDYLSIRNEYMDDMRGQRTGFRTRYSEHLFGWGHWVGTTLLVRPELRFERAYDAPAYNNGTRKNQFTFATDVILFF